MLTIMKRKGSWQRFSNREATITMTASHVLQKSFQTMNKKWVYCSWKINSRLEALKFQVGMGRGRGCRTALLKDLGVDVWHKSLPLVLHVPIHVHVLLTWYKVNMVILAQDLSLNSVKVHSNSDFSDPIFGYECMCNHGNFHPKSGRRHLLFVEGESFTCFLLVV